MKEVYLDSASTAKYRDFDERIIAEMCDAMKKNWMNPSSLYATNVKNVINKCRENVARFINAEANEIIFTSGASESNNMAIKGFIDEHRISKYEKHIYKPILIITTRLEHNSILELCESSSLQAFVKYCDVDEYGFVDIDNLEKLLRYSKQIDTIVSICMANNEIGTVQKIKLISDLVHKYDAIFHCDCTQAFGHIPIDVNELGIDMLSASGHKISPVLRGVGILYKRKNVNIKPLIYGTQENGLRGGTTNTYGIIGLDKALKYCNLSNEHIDDMCAKRDYFINLLRTKFCCKLNGDSKHRLPNNINVTFKDINSESLLYTLDLSGIQCSSGSACNSHSTNPSHVLKEIGLSDKEAMKTVRFSLNEDITYDDIDYVINEIEKSIAILSM